MIVYSKNVKNTQKIATDLVGKIKSFKVDEAIVVALEGELGAGKTVFVKAFAKALGIKDKIKSPTFVLIKKYKIPKTDGHMYHLDCYRLRDGKDLMILGIQDFLRESHNIVFIEWSERVKKILPSRHIKVHIDHIDQHTRKLRISGM